MLRVDHARWDQSPEDLRSLALRAPHARTRERALALFDLAQGACATQVALRTGRHPQTVMGWVHADNERGPEALAYRRTGGRPPFAPRSRPAWAGRCAKQSAGQPVRP
jgi:transposase